MLQEFYGEIWGDGGKRCHKDVAAERDENEHEVHNLRQRRRLVVLAATTQSNGQGSYSTPVTKEECVNHVSKRLGTRLRELKAETFETQTVIDHLTRYYGAAIRKNREDTVQEMKRNILRTCYHSTSKDEEPRHDYCPESEKSWCFFQQDSCQE